MLLFLVCLMMPLYFNIGAVKLTPTRIFLLVMLVPLTVQLLSGKAGKIRGIDICLFFFMLWMAVVLLFHHGLSHLPLSIATTAEMLGGYLVGRVLVRNEANFRSAFKWFLLILIAQLPFVVLELLTNRNLIQELTRLVGPSFFKGDSSYGRMGLNRVMAGFEHPILYGLFCSFGFAIVYYIHRGRPALALMAAAFIGFMTFASLSSAPLLAVAIQLGLILWARLTGERWWLLTVLVSTAYVTVDLLSNRTPITILINYVTFDPNTAWTRVNTWTFGSAELLRHPIMGIGLNDWERPHWLTGSVDNFWLLTGMRYGFPGIGLLLLGLGLGMANVVKAKNLSPSTYIYRTGYLIALVSLYFSLGTVHIWGNSSAFTMMFVGMGIWLANAGNVSAPEAENRTIDRADLRRLGRSAGAMPVGTGSQQAGKPVFSRFLTAHRRTKPAAAVPRDG